MTHADQFADAACSFCGKGPDAVKRLIAGPNVWICDGCVHVCNGILEDVEQEQQAGGAGSASASAGSSDLIMAEIAQAQQAALAGDRAGAERAFAAIWSRLGPDSDPVHRISVAHYMADVQDDPADELDWDLRALAAADSVAREDPAAAAIRRLYASLHVNLASDFAKLDQQERAQHHLDRAHEAMGDLPADGYGALVRSEITAVRERLGE